MDTRKYRTMMAGMLCRTVRHGYGWLKRMAQGCDGPCIVARVSRWCVVEPVKVENRPALLLLRRADLVVDHLKEGVEVEGFLEDFVALAAEHRFFVVERRVVG